MSPNSEKALEADPMQTGPINITPQSKPEIPPTAAAATPEDELADESVDEPDEETAERRAPEPVHAADDDADEREDRDRHAHVRLHERV